MKKTISVKKYKERTKTVWATQYNGTKESREVISDFLGYDVVELESASGRKWLVIDYKKKHKHSFNAEMSDGDWVVVEKLDHHKFLKNNDFLERYENQLDFTKR